MIIHDCTLLVQSKQLKSTLTVGLNNNTIFNKLLTKHFCTSALATNHAFLCGKRIHSHGVLLYLLRKRLCRQSPKNATLLKLYGASRMHIQIGLATGEAGFLREEDWELRA